MMTTTVPAISFERAKDFEHGTYKVFTVAAGVVSMAIFPFTIASLIGRGARFFLVAGLMAWGGARMEAVLHKYIDRLGWATVAVVAIGILIYA